MNLLEGCHSLKLECALRDLGFVDVGWKTIANAGIFIICPFGLPENPEGICSDFKLSNLVGSLDYPRVLKKH